MFDTHCHLTANEFQNDLDDTIQRARDAGITDILAVSLDSEDARKCAEIADKYNLFFTAGIHPHDCDKLNDKSLAKIDALCDNPRCVAIGEIGLDYYRDYAPRDSQLALFREMLKLAVEKHKPVVIHNRLTSGDIIFEIDRIDFKYGGVFHCFSGNIDLMQQVISRGFFVSFAGNITYEKNKLIEVALATPLDHLLIETDAPYLTPHPFRGKRNEPAFIQHTLNHLALTRSIAPNQLDEITTRNGHRLFLNQDNC